MFFITRLIVVSILLGQLVWPPTLLAQMTRPELLTIDDGLSQGMIYDLLQTRDGFLWIATKDGLNRYDGYNFKVFTHSSDNPYTLSENTTTALFEDSRGLLWIGTENKGLNLLDRRTGRFYHLNLPVRKDLAGLSYDVRRIEETPDGDIWVAQMDNGIFRIQVPADWKHRLPDQPALDGFVTIQAVPAAATAAKKDDLSEKFMVLSLAPGGDLLTCTNNGLYRLHPATMQLEHIPLSLPPVPHEKDPLTAALPGPDGEIWVAGYDYAVQLQASQTRVFRFPGVSLFTLVRKDRSGNIWLIAEQKVWRLEAGSTPDPSRPDFILDQAVSCIEQDRNGNIWMGTRGYGLRKFNPQKSLFHAGAAGQSINGLWEDAAGRIYAKTISTIFRYDPLTQQMESRTAFPDAPNRQMDLAFGPGGDTWLLCGIKGDNFTSQLRHYPAGESRVESFPFSHTVYPNTRLFRDREGYLWVTGSGCQLLRFDPKTGIFKSFNFDALFPENAKAIRAFALVTDGRGDLWIGTQAGLVRGIQNGDNIDFQLFTSKPREINSLSSNAVSCLLPDPADPSNVLWIGTRGSGMDRFDFQKGTFLHYTTDNGLPNNVVYGILPDAEGNLWCSTNRGIVRLNLSAPSGSLAQPVATVFTASEGLQSSEFNTQAFWKAPNGALLFGGVNGVNRFFPNELNLKTLPPSVFIVGLEINHRRVSPADNWLPVPMEYLSRLELAHDQNNLSFEFAALDFNDPAKNRYRYQLVGLENDWVDAGVSHFAHYSHLPPGHYVFRVMGGNGNGIWNETPVEISVVILPPWWRSDWAYLCYLLLIAAGIWWAYRFQINRIRLREQLAFEHRETQRVRALEQMKTDFFANVTHEFRTPLTLMLEPVRQLLQNPSDPLLVDKLKLVDRNSHRLLNLVNQLLDLAKLESGGAGLELRHGDVVSLAEGVYRTFSASAEHKGIRFEWSAEPDIPPFMFDAGKVELILNNLISNALKFTPKGGTVRVTIRKKPGALEIQVSDTGIGIPEDALNKVFDRFYQVEGAHQRSGEGTGIGLALSRELAQLMGGDIRADSQAGQGSTFTFILPVKTGEKPTENLTETSPAETQLPARDEAELPLVLIIEDQADLRAFIRLSVGDRWQVAEAANGEEGLRKAQELVPDLVISDLMMPGKDGYQVCEELKAQELTAHIPVILLTAKTALEAKLKGLRSGADDYLNKPFNADELQARMENLVALRRKLLERYEQYSGGFAGQASAAEDLLSPPDQSFIDRFTQTIEEHLNDEKLGVEEFAGKMFVSRVQLHRKLKALTGRSATEFIRDYRLDRAMLLLKNREGGVGEIAMRVGFGNEKYFSTVFKEKFGVSPSQVG